VRFLSYIWRNASRNKLRSLLTVLSVGFGLAMMTILYGYLAMQDVWAQEAEKHNRFVVLNIQGFSGRIPIAYVNRVTRLEGVRAAVPYSWFGGVYKDERMPFAQFATDPEQAFNVWDEFTIPPEQLAAWQNNRRACVVDRALAEQRGWKVGERIPLKGTFYQYDLELELVGIFDTPQPVLSLWFDWQYLEEGLKSRGITQASGNAGMIYAKAASAGVIPGLCRAIDDHYGSSENPTRTQTEAAFAQMFSQMLGNIRLYILVIAVIVTFSLTLVAANGMAMSLRERTTEIAVLKAIGFPRIRVLGLVLGEACFIAGLGGLLGLAFGNGFLAMAHQAMPQMIPVGPGDLAGPWMAGILAVGVGIGFLSGIVPSVRAAQLSVIDGLRRVV
jgi:putative ABC transport system permease protein